MTPKQAAEALDALDRIGTDAQRPCDGVIVRRLVKVLDSQIAAFEEALGRINDACDCRELRGTRVHNIAAEALSKPTAAERKEKT